VILVAASAITTSIDAEPDPRSSSWIVTVTVYTPIAV